MNAPLGGTTRADADNIFTRKRRQSEALENEQLKSHPMYSLVTSGLAEAMRKTLVDSVYAQSEVAATASTQDLLSQFAVHLECDPVMGRKIVTDILVPHLEDISVHSDKSNKKAKVKKET
jgi:hypothetical protein